MSISLHSAYLLDRLTEAGETRRGLCIAGLTAGTAIGLIPIGLLIYMMAAAPLPYDSWVGSAFIGSFIVGVPLGGSIGGLSFEELMEPRKEDRKRFILEHPKSSPVYSPESIKSNSCWDAIHKLVSTRVFQAQTLPDNTNNL